MATARHRRRRQRKTRRQRGGALNCKAFLNNNDLMSATYGTEYYKLHARGKGTGELHSNGERRTLENLDEFTKYGIMEWYSQKLEKKESTEEDR